MIAKGHCEAWILNAFSFDSAILSNTYTFNAACENQKQNVGTEIATENITRLLLADHDVEAWCGTFGNHGTFTAGKVTNTYPAFYWKVIRFDGRTTCYWMPNPIMESQDKLPQRTIPCPSLVKLLNLDTLQIFHPIIN